MSEQNMFIHWPVLVLGVVVAIIFSVVLFVFQVNETEFAVVERFGSPRREMVDGTPEVVVYRPGLHLKVPFVDRVWRHDNRLQVYELKRGQVEQMQTADDFQIIMTTFVLWRVGDPYKFLKAIETTDDAQTKMDELVRSSRHSVVGRRLLEEFINIDAEKQQIEQIEQEMLTGVQAIAMREYGIEIRRIGLKHLGFPEQVTEKVFARMTAERQARAERDRAEGRRLAQELRANADQRAKQILSEARADATQIRGQADQAAAGYYAEFRKNPELAMFLRKLEALRQTLTGKTTLVLDTRTPPYDLLLPGAMNLQTTPRNQTDAENAGKDE